MRTFCLPQLLTALVYYCHADAPTCKDECIQQDHALTSELINWLRENGAYINEKLQVQHVVENDPTSPRGVFATADLKEGETVCRIPWHLILKPTDTEEPCKRSTGGELDCGTIEAVLAAMKDGGSTPYGRYLFNQSRQYTPALWSFEAHDLLVEMLETTREDHTTEWDELPPHGVEEEFIKEEVLNECGSIDDPLYEHAVMIVKTRADYQYLVPYYDMMNHHNGNYNVAHRYNPYKSDALSNAPGYEIVTTKRIKQSEELYQSYNRCNICSDLFDWFGTPELFLHYGFVEPLPQRWLFDFARVKFELVQDEETGKVKVNFLVLPSERGIGMLSGELSRLLLFSERYRNIDWEDEDILLSEWEMLWQYYDALYEALSQAVQQSQLVAMSDDVWNAGDDWWVQEGTLAASDANEHWVYPTINA